MVPSTDGTSICVGAAFRGAPLATDPTLDGRHLRPAVPAAFRQRAELGHRLVHVPARRHRTRYVVSFTAAQLALYAGMGVGRLPNAHAPLTPGGKDAIPSWTLDHGRGPRGVDAGHLEDRRHPAVPRLATGRVPGLRRFRHHRTARRLLGADRAVQRVYLLLRQRLRRNVPIHGFLLWFLGAWGCPARREHC